MKFSNQLNIGLTTIGFSIVLSSIAIFSFFIKMAYPQATVVPLLLAVVSTGYIIALILFYHNRLTKSFGLNQDQQRISTMAMIICSIAIGVLLASTLNMIG